MLSRQSIVVTFHGPTNTQGPRYTAKCAAGRTTVEAADVSIEENASAAARKLATRLGWSGRFTIGTLPSGQFVFTLATTDTEAFTVGTVAPTGPVYLAQYIGTDNDTYGNPRRGWIVTRLDQTGPATWIEEGYGNFPWRAFGTALGMTFDTNAKWYDVSERVRPFVVVTGRLHVTPGEYRDARKLPRFCEGGE